MTLFPLTVELLQTWHFGLQFCCFERCFEQSTRRHCCRSGCPTASECDTWSHILRSVNTVPYLRICSTVHSVLRIQRLESLKYSTASTTALCSPARESLQRRSSMSFDLDQSSARRLKFVVLIDKKYKLLCVLAAPPSRSLRRLLARNEGFS